MSGSVLVTGAGGFIGRAVVTRLTEAGIPVRAGLRRRSAAPPTGADAVPCDLERSDTVLAACTGAAAIVHAAGREPATMAAQLGTLLDAAGRAGVERIVLFSSIAVYGGRTGLVAEDDISGDLDSYGAAKRDCETLVRAWIQDAPPRRRAAILRPGIVYGRGSDLWIERPVAGLRAGAFGHLGPGGEGVAALIHVADVAEATRAALVALASPGPAAFAVNLVGPDTPTWNSYFAALAERLGLPPPTSGPVGRTARRVLAPTAKVFARLGLPVPDALRLAPATGERRLFARSAHYDTARAEAILGFRPMVGLVRGLDESLASPIPGAGYTRVDANAKAASAERAPAAR